MRYTFKLNFKDSNYLMDIHEPDEFDGFSHGIERKTEGFAVDMHLFAENTTLTFTDGNYTKTSMSEDIDGTLLFNLTHGLKRIIDAYEEHGPEANIELLVNLGPNQITQCYFDLEDVDTDMLTYFTCGFIENNKRSKFKEREDDIQIDLYGTKDLDEGNIEPLVPEKILLKSKPTLRKSKWIKTDIYYNGAPSGVTNKLPAGTFHEVFNFCKNPLVYDINDTLVPNPLDEIAEYNDTYTGDMKIIDSKSTKTNLKIVFTQDMKLWHVYNGRTGYVNRTALSLNCRVSYGTGISENIVYTVWSKELLGTTTQSWDVPYEIEFLLPMPLREGEFLTVWWSFEWTSSTIALTSDYSQIDNYSRIIINDCTIDMQAVETTINSVVQGNRWINMLKKSCEIISPGMTVDAPRIDVGGEYYDMFFLNGAGIRNIDNVPFNLKAKDAFETCMMLAMDYQVTKSDIKVGTYSDFFSDRIIRSFDVKPSEKFKWNTSKRFRIKAFDFIFENYEQDRDEQNTLDAVHTEAQFLTTSTKPNDTNKVKVKQIVDVYKIDSLRFLGINPDTKDSSLTDDTKLVMLNVVQLASDHKETHTGIFYISKTVTGIKIVSTNFRWDKIGLSLTSSFEILTGENIGTYTITNIESTLLTLTTISAASNETISEIITIRYSLPGVLLTNRTNELFDVIEGVEYPDNYGNLILSIKRSMFNWLPFLATCSMRALDKILKNSFFKSNKNLVTKLISETSTVVDSADITAISIANLKRVTDRTFDVEIYLNNPGDIQEIFNEIDTRNVDGSIGGAYEFNKPDGKKVIGYPMKFEYIIKENKIEAVCLEKYVNDFYEIVNSERTTYSHFETNGIYVNLYSFTGVEIFKAKRFTKIKINGTSYTSLELFINDLNVYFS